MALATIFLRVSAWWVLMLVRQCLGPVGQFGLSGELLLHVLRRRDLLRLCLRILRVFFLFWTCAPENINLQKQLWS